MLEMREPPRDEETLLLASLVPGYPFFTGQPEWALIFDIQTWCELEQRRDDLGYQALHVQMLRRKRLEVVLPAWWFERKDRENEIQRQHRRNRR